jgi:ferritin-like metal-binding protein YciE
VTELTTRDTKLIQYLNEAYGKEKQLETALQAHIAMTTRAPYRKRLKQHLTETKRHAREVERRIKRLGGVPELIDLPGPEAISQGASAAVELGSRAIAAVKGPLHAIRGIGEQEKMLKNAKTEYSEEHEEIATYTAIEVLAKNLGDSETASLAKAIRREEERMAGFLARLIPGLTKAVIQEEIPAAERATRASSRKRSTASSSKRAGGTSRASAAKSKGAKGTTAKKTKARASSKASAARSTAKAAAKRAPVRRAKKAAAAPRSAARGKAPAKRPSAAAGR